jgi:predicted CoA-binding protein
MRVDSIPGGVDAVVIGTRPNAAEETMRECVELGIDHFWMHRSFGRLAPTTRRTSASPPANQ